MDIRVRVPQINEYARSIKPLNRFLRTTTPLFQESRQIVFDFSKCGFITAEGIALLAGLKLLRDERGYKTTINKDSIKSRVRVILERWGFIGLFESEGSSWRPNHASKTSTLPIYRQHKLNKSEISSYIDKEILSRTEMPEMSSALQKEIRKAFFEIFSNIFAHSSSPIGGIVCGQVFPKDKVIQIVFYDAGKGIANNVCNYEPSIHSDDKAIEWALEMGTSTLSSASEARGLGLFVIRMFLKANEGEFRIYANQGSVREISGRRQCERLPYFIPGTLIDMRVRVRNDVKYILASEDEI
jgi:anti-sigma regulatory factor (Ser/Thr protein kinase)